MKNELIREMLDFINDNPTAFHAAAAVGNMLRGEGFEELFENESWGLKPEGKYYVKRNDSSILAFVLGKDASKCGFNLIASHTDSPCFKLKEKAEIHNEFYTRINTEGYGGMICSTWLDRPLSIAGRVILKDENGKLYTKLLKFDRDLLMIPSVAIHMNRDANENASFNKQVDMMPLLSGKTEEGILLKLISEEMGVKEENIVGSDLYLYNRSEASVWGAEKEFVSAPKLDDQECVFASVKALIESECTGFMNMIACLDNEEVGSGTKQGADSSFVYDVIKRIFLSLGKTEEELFRAVAEGFMISADNAHAVHPNHPEHTDNENCVYMNEGVVIKNHAGQKYTSDGVSIAVLRSIAEKAGVPLQYFANRSDKIGGSTLGNILTSHLSIMGVDIGIPQLAMHSSYETSGVKDIESMVRLMGEFLSTDVSMLFV